MDVTLRDAAKAASPATLQRGGAQMALRIITGLTALVSFSVIFLMLFFLIVYAYPAIRFNGLNFFSSLTWNIGNQYGSGSVTRNGFTAESGASFGALVFIFGSAFTAFLTMIVSVPLSLMVALAIVYRVPRQIRPLANALVELMAGVPSVDYGLWGMVVLVLWIGSSFAPFVVSHFGFVPFLGGSAGSGMVAWNTSDSAAPA